MARAGEQVFGEENAAGEPAAKVPCISVAGEGIAGLVRAPVSEVGSVTPVSDFEAMLAAGDEQLKRDAVRGLSAPHC